MMIGNIFLSHRVDDSIGIYINTINVIDIFFTSAGPEAIEKIPLTTIDEKTLDKIKNKIKEIARW